jgi:hypothetical protein
MKNIMLLITVGTRDVSIDRGEAKRLFGKEYSLVYNGGQFKPRPAGKLFLEELQKWSPNSSRGAQVRDALRLPLIDPVLNYLSMEDLLSEVKSVEFIATDQPEDVEEKFRSRDTLNLAKVLEQLLREREVFAGECSFNHFHVKENVTSMESNNDLFADYVSNLDWSYPKYDQLFLVNQGGIDAINQPLLLNCLNRFGGRLVNLHISEETNTCRVSEYPSRYLRERSVLQANIFLSTYDYAAIKQLEGLPKDAYYLASSLAARLGFDFDRARNEAGKISEASKRRRLVKVIDHIRSEEGKLTELYRNARIKLESQNYVDYLLRMFRYLEEISRREVKRLTGLDGNVKAKKWQEQVEKFKATGDHEALFEATSRQKTREGYDLDISRSGIPSFLAIWEYYEPEKAKPFKIAYALVEIRNRSIGAHDFDPVSKGIIDEKLNKEAGINLKTLTENLDAIQLTDQEEVYGFDAMNEVLRELLQAK